MFPFALYQPEPPPLVAPCAENPLPEPAPPPSGAGRGGPEGDGSVAWADVGRARDPDVVPSLDWAVWQLIPSPELGVGGDGAVFGLRWQVTPLLYSFATDARLSRWRWLVVEPIVRHSGSVELFASPEYLALNGGIGARFGVRGGVRAYWGVLGRGDNLSLSIGSSAFHFRDVDGVSVEAGAYILFGGLGLVVTYSPGFDAAPWLMTLRLRYF